jgi:hypothetical protein
MASRKFKSCRLHLSAYGLRAIIKSQARVSMALLKLSSYADTAAIGMNLLAGQTDHEIISEFNVLSKRDYYFGYDIFLNIDVQTAELGNAIVERLKGKTSTPAKLKDIVLMALLTPITVDDVSIHTAEAQVPNPIGSVKIV